MGDLTTADCKEMLGNLIDTIPTNAWKRTRKWKEGTNGVIRSFENTQNTTTALIVDEGNGNTHCLAYEPTRPSFCIDISTINPQYSHHKVAIITNKKVTLQGFEECDNFQENYHRDDLGIIYRVDDVNVAKTELLRLGFVENSILLFNGFPWANFSALQAVKYWEVIGGKITVESIAGLGWAYEHCEEDEVGTFFVQPMCVSDVADNANDQGFPFDIHGFNECMEVTLEADSSIKNPETELEKFGFVKSKKKISFY